MNSEEPVALSDAEREKLYRIKDHNLIYPITKLTKIMRQIYGKR